MKKIFLTIMLCIAVTALIMSVLIESMFFTIFNLLISSVYAWQLSTCWCKISVSSEAFSWLPYLYKSEMYHRYNFMWLNFSINIERNK